MNLSTAELSSLTRLFSSAVFRELAKSGRSALFSRLVDQTRIGSRCGAFATVSDAFDLAFATLRIAGHRDEYVYRAALTTKVLMGTHSLRTASMLNEFRVGTCKADLVILNGTASVYEIKSERDSLARLLNQVENYKKVFATVNVIASENHVDGVRMVVPDDVGILCLSRRYSINVVRKAIDIPQRICPLTVLESLRSAEAVEILNALGVETPNVPNTQRYRVLRELFATLKPVDLHREMVSTLKRTRTLAPLSVLVDKLPKSLHAAALSIPLRQSEHSRLVQSVSVPLSAAMAWA